MTDIHGEYEQFLHVLKNGSGSVRRKIDEELGNTLSSRDKKSLATLVYYPKRKLDMVEKTEDNLEDWYKITLHRLIQICKRVSSKYTRSKVRKALPKDFAYVIEELITEKMCIRDRGDRSFPSVLAITTAEVEKEQNLKQEESSQYIDYGHVKAVILSQEIAEDGESLKEVLLYLEDRPVFARSIFIFAGDEQVLKAAETDSEQMGAYRCV